MLYVWMSIGMRIYMVISKINVSMIWVSWAALPPKAWHVLPRWPFWSTLHHHEAAKEDLGLLHPSWTWSVNKVYGGQSIYIHVCIHICVCVCVCVCECVYVCTCSSAVFRAASLAILCHSSSFNSFSITSFFVWGFFTPFSFGISAPNVSL